MQCNMQTVNIVDMHASCKLCGKDILDIINFKYTGKTIPVPTWSEEVCVCRNCGAEFLIHYDFFDPDGHINARTFIGDVNNAEYNWQDNLSDEQKILVMNHLKNCPTCVGRLDEETLTDAWFGSLIRSKRAIQKSDSGV